MKKDCHCFTANIVFKEKLIVGEGVILHTEFQNIIII